MCLNTSYSIITPKWGKMRVNEVQISKVLKYHEVTYQITSHFLCNLKNSKNKTTKTQNSSLGYILAIKYIIVATE